MASLRLIGLQDGMPMVFFLCLKQPQFTEDDFEDLVRSHIVCCSWPNQLIFVLEGNPFFLTLWDTRSRGLFAGMKNFRGLLFSNRIRILRFGYLFCSFSIHLNISRQSKVMFVHPGRLSQLVSLMMQVMCLYMNENQRKLYAKAHKWDR